MCRNIKKLRRKDEKPTESELRDAALQYVRKISGFRVPSRTNEPAFEQAIANITVARGIAKNRLMRANFCGYFSRFMIATAGAKTGLMRAIFEDIFDSPPKYAGIQYITTCKSLD